MGMHGWVSDGYKQDEKSERAGLGLRAAVFVRLGQSEEHRGDALVPNIYSCYQRLMHLCAESWVMGRSRAAHVYRITYIRR